MSKIRTQLDSIMAASRGGEATQQPATQVPPTQTQTKQAPADLRAVQESLDALANKLASIRPASAAQPMQPAPYVEQTVAQQPASMGLSSAQLDSMRTELRRSIQEVRGDVLKTPNAVSAAVSSAVSQNLAGDLQRIAEGVRALHENGRIEPDYLNRMNAEISRVQQGVDQIALMQERVAKADDVGQLTQTFSNGYSEIVNKLDEMLASRGDNLPGLPQIEFPDYAPQFQQISERIDTIQKSLAALPQQVSQSGQTADAMASEFKSVHQRLEEVTRAVVSMSVSPGNNTDQHTIERIEARLASLAKSLDDMQALGAPTVDLAPIESNINAHHERVTRELEQLSQRMETLAQSTSAGSDAGPSPEIEALVARMDSVQSEIGMLASSVENLGQLNAAPAQAAGVSGNFDQDMFMTGIANIEQRIGDLANRLEMLGSAPAASHVQGADSGEAQEILSVMRELVGRVEAIERLANEAQNAEPGSVEPHHSVGGMVSDERFDALEAQLASITAQLESLPGSAEPMDLSSLSQRLDEIESQIAVSRDMMAEAAAEAAQRAIEAIGPMNAQAVQAIDNSQYETLFGELQALRENGIQGGVDTATISQLVEAIEVVSQRVATLSTSGLTQNAQVAAAATAHVATQPVSAMADAAGGSMERPVARDPAELMREDANQETYAEAAPVTMMGETPPLAPNESDPWDTGLAPDVDLSDAAGEPQGEPEDVPIAPGSGVPDLEALVRKASNRKRETAAKVGEKSGDDDSISELMAAARRAAQASAQKQMTQEAEVKPKSGKAKIAAVGEGSLFNKKILMMSAAALAIAAAGFVLAPKFLGSAPTANAPAPISQSSKPKPSSGAGQNNAGSNEVAATANSQPVTDAGDGAGDGIPRVVGSDDEATQDDAAQGAVKLAEEIEAEADETSARNASSNGDLTVQSPQVALAGLPEGFATAALSADIEAGDPNAMFEVARRFTDGDGVERSFEDAVQWYRKAAETGHPPAQYRLGNFYEKGHGLEADIAEAASWYEKAAANGNALAMHNLAVLNVQGLMGTDPDMETAIGWFEKAANLGVKDSQVNLGILYTRGMGVDADLVQAYKWFAVAAKGGDADAASKRDTVAKNMRPDQLEQARGEADLWKPQQLDREANIAEVKDSWSAEAPRSETRQQLSKTEIVKRTQFILGKIGYDAGPADGIFGSKTEQAIRRFQESQGLPVDGRITPQLMEKLSQMAI